ncbi:hypothetical protein VTL71DRAFT_2704 [Oculimacula yallundae]|uniref:C2H2-type domain-containing protein n=1 Tax=Oculimacula yallundae TaxID=86028 RepID=A0ABR4C9L5_9HELO
MDPSRFSNSSNRFEEDEDTNMEDAPAPAPPADLTWFSTASFTNTDTYRGSNFDEPTTSSQPTAPRSPSPSKESLAAERRCKAIHLVFHLLKYCKACPHEGCIKTFASRQARDNHVAAGDHIFEEPPETPECKICGKMLSTRGGWKAHMMSQHPGEKNEAKVGDEAAAVQLSFKEPPECKIRQKTFSSKGNLKTHLIRQHPGEKNEPKVEEEITIKEPPAPPECKICQKTFSNKWNLKIHMMRKHPGVEIEAKGTEEDSMVQE